MSLLLKSIRGSKLRGVLPPGSGSFLSGWREKTLPSPLRFRLAATCASLSSASSFASTPLRSLGPVQHLGVHSFHSVSNASGGASGKLLAVESLRNAWCSGGSGGWGSGLLVRMGLAGVAVVMGAVLTANATVNAAENDSSTGSDIFSTRKFFLFLLKLPSLCPPVHIP